MPRFNASETGLGREREAPAEGGATPPPPSVEPGKFMHVEVPDFSLETPGMTSYLHLGAVRDPAVSGSASAPPTTGEDLASRVTSFADDTRARDGCPDFVPVAERQATTSMLHVLGGWRDHTDGNRISTTRGDKIEVVKGNYSMVVLGRREDRAGWDVSGGHVSQNGITYSGGGGISYTTAEYNGTWVVQEEVVKGDVTSYYHGYVRDTFWGDEKTSTTGAEAPTAERPNPVITDHTWALAISSYTGSSALPVPSIQSETWAESITSTTNADAVTDTTTVSGAITSTTTAALVADTTTAGIVASTTIGNVMDTTVGASTSLILGAESETIIGNSMEINVGAQESITLGATFDLTLGLAVNLTLAMKLSVEIGPSVEIDVTLREEKKPMREHSEGQVARASAVETKVNGAHTVGSPVSLLG